MPTGVSLNPRGWHSWVGVRACCLPPHPRTSPHCAAQPGPPNRLWPKASERQTRSRHQMGSTASDFHLPMRPSSRCKEQHSVQHSTGTFAPAPQHASPGVCRNGSARPILSLLSLPHLLPAFLEPAGVLRLPTAAQCGEDQAISPTNISPTQHYLDTSQFTGSNRPGWTSRHAVGPRRRSLGTTAFTVPPEEYPDRQHSTHQTNPMPHPHLCRRPVPHT